MKILFLQNTDDAMGGIANVNISLMKKFIADGKKVSVVSVRHSGKNMKMNYPEPAVRILINADEVWGCPRYNQAVEYLKNGEILSAFHQIKERLHYNKCIGKDYLKCKEVIREEHPDIIINSHYELLDAIPEEFLTVTINHFHTSFDQVLENGSYIKTFERYKNKIAKFVWLSEATCQRAKDAGLVNSTCIYNPVAFKMEKMTDVMQKRMVFIGRFSEEKRLDRAVRLFHEVVTENEIKDWTFDIYGVGRLDEAVQEMIEQSDYIHLKGKTDNTSETLLNYSIFLLTSQYEGMALVVLEANECGLPVVCFNFGEAAEEEIIQGETGFIVEQNHEEEYKERMLLLMKDEKLRQKMSEHSKQFAKRFHIETIAEKWELLFDEIKQ